MKKIKISKKDLKDAVSLLKKAKAINENIKTAYPQHVYCSEKDYSILEDNIIKQMKLEYSMYNKEIIEYAVSAYLLDFGPNVSKKKVASGYILVDDVELKKDMNRDDPRHRKTKLGKILYKDNK